MNQIIWGLVSALSLGSADFLARFSARAVGHTRALLGVFIVSSICLSAYMVVTDQPMMIDLIDQWRIVLFGVMNTVAMLFMYRALARGPLSLVAPIIAAHPAIVVVFAFLLGSRPSDVQWLGMILAVIGTIVVARVVNETNTQYPDKKTTIKLSLYASLAYAILIIAGQSAVPIHGELQTLWLGRIVALVSLIPLFFLTKKSVAISVGWIAFLCLQGTLDFLGLLFLLLGSHGEFTEITAVVGSLFGAVTILLARLFLKELISRYQWSGIILIFFGVMCLAGGSNYNLLQY